MKNVNQHKGSDSDSNPDSDPEYLDYLKEIQAENKRKKNGKKPKQLIIPKRKKTKIIFLLLKMK